MKKLFLLSIFIIYCNLIHSQSDLPRSFANIGLGAGTNYGLLGIKTILGYKNSGLLLGIGTLGGVTGFEVGGQISIQSLYINAGYGTYGFHENGATGKKDLLKGGNCIIGGMINLGKTKAAFIDLGIGLSWGAKSMNLYGQSVQLTTLSGVIGIGLRIGGENNPK